MPQYSQDFDVISKKQKKNKQRSSVFHILISQCHFDGPSESHGPSAGPHEANEPHDGTPEAHGPPDGPPKVHGPRGHFPPAPRLIGPAGK